MTGTSYRCRDQTLTKIVSCLWRINSPYVDIERPESTLKNCFSISGFGKQESTLETWCGFLKVLWLFLEVFLILKYRSRENKSIISNEFYSVCDFILILLKVLCLCYIVLFVVCWMILMLICWLMLYFNYSYNTVPISGTLHRYLSVCHSVWLFDYLFNVLLFIYLFTSVIVHSFTDSDNYLLVYLFSVFYMTAYVSVDLCLLIWMYSIVQKS